MASPAVLPLLMFQMQLAANISSVMDTTVDPCVDFYQFACGNYKNVTSISEGNFINRITEANIAIRNDMRVLVEGPDRSDDPPSTLMVKRLYRSCMDVDKLEKLGVEPLKALLDKYGGWPVLMGAKWRSASYDWMKTNALITLTASSGDNEGSGDIVKFYVESDLKNSSRWGLTIDQADLYLGDRKYYLDQKYKPVLDAYTEFRLAFANQLGASSRPSLAVWSEMQELMDFEIQLANISEPSEREPAEIYQAITVKDLKSKYPWAGFGTWFKTVADAGWNLTDSDVIDLDGGPYLDRLGKIYSKYSKRALANFQMWRLAANYIPYLAPSLLETYNKFRAVRANYTLAVWSRWQNCFFLINKELPVPVGAAYVRKYFKSSTKSEVDDLMLRIRKVLSETINEVSWMDDESKLRAQTKLSKVKQQVAYPDPEIFDETWVMSFFAQATISPDAYLDNMVSLRASAMKNKIRIFREPIQSGTVDEVRTGAIAEANYATLYDSNTIVLLAGLLRLPLYDSQAPDYFNSGRIGPAIGMLLSHFFDKVGQEYDGDGNAFTNWWTAKTTSEFDKLSKCVIEQYNNLTDSLTGIRLNGEQLLITNIANNGGLKLAYKAFKTARQDPSVGSKDQNRILKGFEKYTADQLFFLSSAQAECELIRKEFQVYSMAAGYPPADIKSNVAMQNYDQFAVAFKCPSGSPMNPVKKCHVW